MLTRKEYETHMAKVTAEVEKNKVIANEVVEIFKNNDLTVIQIEDVISRVENAVKCQAHL